MQPKKPRLSNGFTLVEVLCVMLIIGILASLLLGAVSRAYGRAKRMQREFEWPAQVEYVRDRLTAFCEAQPLFPALSAEQLRALGIFDSRIMDFLRCRGVEFRPFASGDDTNRIVLEVWYSKTNVERVRKADLRRREE